MSKNTVLVASVCARPYVISLLQAGYQVLAIDIFKDVEIQKLTKHCYQVKLNNSGFDKLAFKAVLNQIDWSEVIGFVYGSGFESAPELLNEVARYTKLLGNPESVCQRVKSIPNFFELLDDLNLVYPAVSYQALQNNQAWLEKSITGSGGMHIQMANAHVVPKEGCYYQQWQAGESVSVLFLADGKSAQLIGFNQQFVAESKAQPYRFGGSVSHVSLAKEVQQQLLHAISCLTQTLGLIGLNSLDVIVKHEKVYVLEINPRLSATIALYEASQPKQSLLAWHIAACNGDMPTVEVAQNSMACAILYAEQRMQISADFTWPAWVVDVPEAGLVIEVDAPICTITAMGKDHDAAKELLKHHIDVCLQNIKTMYQHCEIETEEPVC
jgi:uncharacterized protein